MGGTIGVLLGAKFGKWIGRASWLGNVLPFQSAGVRHWLLYEYVLD